MAVFLVDTPEFKRAVEEAKHRERVQTCAFPFITAIHVFLFEYAKRVRLDLTGKDDEWAIL